MKRHLLTFIGFLLLALAFASCSDDDNKGVSPVDEYTAMAKVSGAYYGDLFENGNGNFTLELFPTASGSAGKPAAESFSVRLDFFSILAASPDDALPDVGKYTPGVSGAKSTFVPGKLDVESGDYEGSMYLVADKEGKIVADPISGGSFEISRNGTSYTITTDLVTAGGKTLKCKYTGSVLFEDKTLAPTVIPQALGAYYGDRLENGNGNFALDLVNGELGEDGELTGEGFCVKIDLFSILAADPDNATPEPGVYSLATSGAVSTFMPGRQGTEIGSYTGTVYIESNEKGEKTVDPVNGGSFEISKEGASYTITTNLTTAGGKTLRYKYSGAVVFENRVPEPPFTIKNAFGQYMDIYFTINYDLHLYSGEINENMDIVGDGFRIFFECLSPDMYEDRYEMPPGIYTAAAGQDMEDWTFARGERNGDRLVSSQLREYKDSQMTATAITEGKLTLARTGNVYTVTIDVTLEDERTIQTTFEGEIGFEEMGL